MLNEIMEYIFAGRKPTKAERFAMFLRNAKTIYDTEMFGGPSERVEIRWGNGNRIGFDKPVGVEIEAALEEISKVINMRKNGELEEFDLDEMEKNMPRYKISDFIKERENEHAN